MSKRICIKDEVMYCKKRRRKTDRSEKKKTVYSRDVDINWSSKNSWKHLTSGRGTGYWKSVGCRRWQTKRYVWRKFTYWKRFGTGSIDGLSMFSGITFSTLQKGKCWARLLGLGKDLSYCTILWKRHYSCMCPLITAALINIIMGTCQV